MAIGSGEDAAAAIGPEAREFQPNTRGIVARVVVAVAIAAAIPILLQFTDSTWSGRVALAIIFALIGLSVNVITGHAGQISLGHQAFVGMGAFSSAFIVTKMGAGFLVAIVAAGVTGAVMALALGLVALRVRGLYLALVTLSFGLMAENTIFNLREFTGGGAGTPAPRPAAFESERAYAYLAYLVLGLFLFVDWRLVKSKAGRAIVALRNDERVAATLGVNVVGYKLFAFVLSGLMAGVAGSLLAHRSGFANAEDFQLQVALIWVIMAVVGGLGSRAGVVVGSMFFALFQTLVPELYRALPGGAQQFLEGIGLNEVSIVVITPLIGALLLILTLTLYPGGIGQQLLPLRRWLAGGRFLGHHEKPKKAKRSGKRRRSAPVVGPRSDRASSAEADGEADPNADPGDPDATTRIPTGADRDATAEVEPVEENGASEEKTGKSGTTRRKR